jgi:hypothetical protein
VDAFVVLQKAEAPQNVENDRTAPLFSRPERFKNRF